MQALGKVLLVLVVAYLALALISPPLANQITNVITFNWDAIDWSRVNDDN